MRKNILTITWIIFLIIIALVSFKYESDSFNNNVPYVSSVVGLETIDMEMNVNQDDSIDVKEQFTFNLVEGVPFDGIKVNLPLKDKINERRNLKLSKISSNDVSIDQRKRFNYIEAHLGKNNEKMAPGLYTYTLNYHYDLGNNDRLIYKVLDNLYDTDIYNLKLVVNLPDKIDDSKVKFLSDGEDVTNRVSFGIEDKVLRASFADFILKQDLVIDIDMEGIFNKSTKTDGFIGMILLIIIALVAIVLLVLSILKHRKSKSKKDIYNHDMRCLLATLFLTVLLMFTYLFFNDLAANLQMLFYIDYGIIFVCGLALILRLKIK